MLNFWKCLYHFPLLKIYCNWICNSMLKLIWSLKTVLPAFPWHPKLLMRCLVTSGYWTFKEICSFALKGFRIVLLCLTFLNITGWISFPIIVFVIPWFLSNWDISTFIIKKKLLLLQIILLFYLHLHISIYFPFIFQMFPFLLVSLLFLSLKKNFCTFSPDVFLNNLIWAHVH